ncbi:1-deoxyxylulose-5-phosphate synthase YajO [Candidatus Entotheonellaceae bacterium PAL068K]
MEYRRLGSAGIRVSVIGLGTNRYGTEALPQPEVDKIIDAAVELGINFIDTSNTYTQQRSEETLGHALKGRWDTFVVATKFVLPVGAGPNDRGASRYHMRHALEASLRRLQTDHINLYYLHRWDPQTPIEETLRALDDLVRTGKIQYLGVSDYAAWQLAQANVLAEVRGWTPLVVIQSEYHLLQRDVEREVLPYCRDQNVGFVPYYPLAGGFLTGKYRRHEPPPPGSRGETNARLQQYMVDATYDLVESLHAWAADRGRDLNELAHAWLLAQPQVCSVISGATQLKHVLSNARAATWELSAAELTEIEALLAPDTHR